MRKLTKAEAVYFPPRYVDGGGIGTRCGKCRDFIILGSECVIVDDPRVDGKHGTCTQFILGPPHHHGVPLRLIPKALVGYEESSGVPTYCGRCEYYENIASRSSTCAKVGDTDDDTVGYGGCCNLYHER